MVDAAALLLLDCRWTSMSPRLLPCIEASSTTMVRLVVDLSLYASQGINKCNHQGRRSVRYMKVISRSQPHSAKAANVEFDPIGSNRQGLEKAHSSIVGLGSAPCTQWFRIGLIDRINLQLQHSTQLMQLNQIESRITRSVGCWMLDRQCRIDMVADARPCFLPSCSP